MASDSQIDFKKYVRLYSGTFYCITTEKPLARHSFQYNSIWCSTPINYCQYVSAETFSC